MSETNQCMLAPKEWQSKIEAVHSLHREQLEVIAVSDSAEL